LHRPAIERVIAAMRGRVDDALPLHVMAEIACFSPYPFARSFRQITGIPPASS
jgi:transcriptional regulator GlxA family with amidase domain